MEHYFTKTPGSERIDKRLAVTLAGKKFSFTASNGVFSKNRLDFGTELLINTLIEVEESISGAVLDLGCGYGPIGVTLAAFNPTARIVMADINERAVELAAANAVENMVPNATAVQSDGFESIEGLFDIIVTNPPIRSGKQNVTRLISEAYAYMLPSARFYAVVGKKQGAESYGKIIGNIFGNCAVLTKKSGYYIFSSSRC